MVLELNLSSENPSFPDTAPTANPVFYRTYSRKFGKRRESWQEVCDRSVRGLVKLGNLSPSEEALLRRMQSEIKSLPSGRWLWVGGTPWIEKPENFSGAYNCTSTNIIDWDAFGLMMDLAMMGSGTGAVLEPQYISQLPPITNRLNVNVIDDLGARVSLSEENSIFEVRDGVHWIFVGDSRQGWVSAYTELLKLASQPGLPKEVSVVVDLGYVRPAGEPLKGFGGVSNPIRLPELFPRMVAILNNAVGRQLTSVECCLLIDEAAATVVAGNIRRCLPGDTLVATDKGDVPIKDIQVGDLVMTPIGYQKVVETFDQGYQEVLKIITANGFIRSTANHVHAIADSPFALLGSFDESIFADPESWKEAKSLVVNDLLIYRKASGDHAVAPITNIIKESEQYYTFDIEVEKAHCFYANGFLTHNSAGMRQGSSEDPEFAAAKDNLWSQDSAGQWQIDPSRDALRMANHTRVYHHQPTEQECLEAVRKQFHSGEGAIQYAPEAIARANADLLDTPERKKKFLDNYQYRGRNYTIGCLEGLAHRMFDDYETDHRLQRYGLNPCFRGDMKLLTVDGYYTFKDLDGTEPEIINASGHVSKSRVWCSGEKEVIALELSNSKTIVCTPDHLFLTGSGEFQAKDLLGKTLVEGADTSSNLITRVVGIKDAGIAKVYDFTEPSTHWGVVEGFVVHNCGEIIGSDFHCNLSEIHLNQLDPLNLEEQESAFKAGALSVAVLLNHQFVEPRYQKSRGLDPIVGVSITGLFDFFVHAFGVDWLRWWEAGRTDSWGQELLYVVSDDSRILGEEYYSHYDIKIQVPSEIFCHSGFAKSTPGKVFKRLEQLYLSAWKEVVHQTVWEYCDRHQLKRPNRCTTVQPAGSKSLLTGASSGWHPPKAQRFIRRITFRKDDPVARTCMEYGYSVVPSQSDKDEQGKLLDDPFDPRCTEWLVEIPMEVSWANLPGADEIAIEKFSALAQFDFWMQVQRYYTTHNTSATIELEEHEIEGLATRIHSAIANNEGYISTTLLARNNAPFPRLPFEKVDKATFARWQAEVLARRKTDNFHAALMRHDLSYTSEEGPAGCDSDKCMFPTANL